MTHPVEWTRNLRSPIRPRKEATWYKHATQDVRRRQKLVEKHCTALKKKIVSAEDATKRKEATLRHVMNLIREVRDEKKSSNNINISSIDNDQSAVRNAFENLDVQDLEKHLQSERGDSLSGEGIGSLSYSQIDEIDEEPSVTLLKAADQDENDDDDDDDDALEPSFVTSPEITKSKLKSAVMGDTAAAVMTETALRVRNLKYRILHHNNNKKLLPRNAGTRSSETKRKDSRGSSLVESYGNGRR